MVPLPRLVGWAWREPSGPRDPRAEARAIATVVRLRRLTFGDRGDCLQGSLVLFRELSRAGAGPRLLIGFRRTEGRMAGHAWIVVDGRVVAEPANAVGRFVETIAFGERGVRVDATPPGADAPPTSRTTSRDR